MRLLPSGALHDLQSAGLLAAAAEAGVAAAVAVVVGRNAERPLEDEPLEAACIGLARSAADVLSSTSA